MKNIYIIVSIMLLILLTGCNKKHTEVIANISEASGICYSKVLNSLFVANDEGTIYEVTKDGKIVRKKYLGDYDLEGVACNNQKQELLFAVEGKDNVLVVDMISLREKSILSIKRKFQGLKVLKKDKSHGLEGITIDDKGVIYVTNQSYDFLPSEDPSVIIKINKKGEISKLYDVGFTDLAGITFHNGLFYLVSDDEDLLIEYDLYNNRIIKTIKLNSARAQEGICFDDEGAIYIADDEGYIVKRKG